MAELSEKDPQLVAVVDVKTDRNLLDTSNPKPLVVDLSTGKAQRFSLRIENGPEGLIDLAIAGDQPWLQPETNKLTLVGGENGECIVVAKPDGDGEFATLLLSWEGMERTLSQSLMLMRNLSDAEAGGDSEPVRPPKPQRSAAIRKLEKYIEGCGGNDKYIDHEEEQKIFRNGGRVELTLTEIEALLNRKCSEGGWTRCTRLTEKLTAMLNEATKDDGVIDQQEFGDVVNFAVKRKMPRKEAVEHCVTLILDNRWKAKEGLLSGGSWFKKLCSQLGLR
jgi:hypothetical protein